MYKISYKSIKFITKAMRNKRVELTAGGKTWAEGKIQRDIFQGGLALTIAITNRKDATQLYT